MKGTLSFSHYCKSAVRNCESAERNSPTLLTDPLWPTLQAYRTYGPLRMSIRGFICTSNHFFFYLQIFFKFSLCPSIKSNYFFSFSLIYPNFFFNRCQRLLPYLYIKRIYIYRMSTPIK